MKPPITYADWVDVFERFGKGEDVSEEMNSGHFELDAGTAQRFYEKADDSYKARKKLWLDSFQKNFKIQDIKTIEELEFVLQNNKKTLSVLSKFINSKGLPKEIKENFQKDFTTFVSDFKKMLKDNTQKDEKEREKILITINSFSFGDSSQEQLIESTNLNSSTGRKIIF